MKYGRYVAYNDQKMILLTREEYDLNYIPNPEFVQPEPIRNVPRNEPTSFSKKRARGAPRAPGAQQNRRNQAEVDDLSSDEEYADAIERAIAAEDDDDEGPDEPEEDDIPYSATRTHGVFLTRWVPVSESSRKMVIKIEK